MDLRNKPYRFYNNIEKTNIKNIKKTKILSQNFFILYITIILTIILSINYTMSLMDNISQDDIETYYSTINQSYKRYIELHPGYNYLNSTIDNINISKLTYPQENIFYLKNDEFISNSIYLELLLELENKHYQTIYNICQNDSIKITNKEEQCQNIEKIIQKTQKKETNSFTYKELLLLYSSINDLEYQSINKMDILSFVTNQIKKENYKSQTYDFKSMLFTEKSLYNINYNSQIPYDSIEISKIDIEKYKNLEDFVLIKEKSTIQEILEKTDVIYNNEELINNKLKNDNENQEQISLNQEQFNFLKNDIFIFNPNQIPTIQKIEKPNIEVIRQNYNDYLYNIYEKNKNNIFSKIDEIYKVKINVNLEEDTETNSNTETKKKLELNFRENNNILTNATYFIYITNFKDFYEEHNIKEINKDEVFTINQEFDSNELYYIIITKEEMFDDQLKIDIPINFELVSKKNFMLNDVILIDSLFENSLEISESQQKKINSNTPTSLINLNNLKEKGSMIFAYIVIIIFISYVLYSIYTVFYKKKKFHLIFSTKSFGEKNNTIKNEKEKKRNEKNQEKDQIREEKKKIKEEKRKLKLEQLKLKKIKSDKNQKNNLENKKEILDNDNFSKIKLENTNQSLKNNSKKTNDINELMKLNSKDIEEFRKDMVNVANKVNSTQLNYQKIDQLSNIIKKEIKKMQMITLNSKSQKSKLITKKIDILEKRIEPKKVAKKRQENKDLRRFLK